MSEKPKNPVRGKIFNAAIDFACKNNPKIFAGALQGGDLARVFVDKDLVESCMSLFENDLNVSLAAQKLYMHRNTLIYRIKKIERLTGLNVSKFSDAVNFIVLYQAYKRQHK